MPLIHLLYQLRRVQHGCSCTQSSGSVPSIVETRDENSLFE